MKKFFMLMVIGLLSVSLWSCSDDDDNETAITIDRLPSAAKSFLSTYYPNVEILEILKDTDHKESEYEVKLRNGHEVEFNALGEWIDIDAPAGESVPTAIIPEGIQRYVTDYFPEYFVNELTKTSYGYEAELTSGLELQFDSQGIFIGHLD